MKPLLFAVALIASAASLGAPSNPDSAFYKKATEGGLAEIELGALAQEKSASASVRDFGAMMVKDHSAANDKLKRIADSKSIKLPTSPNIKQKAPKAKLKVLSGEKFDKSYIKGVIADHGEDIKEFKKEAASGQDTDAKAYAAATLPTLEAHLKKIQSIAKDAGIATHDTN